jgi:phosphoglycerol transferase MdoB-like AlkP superfamily enzyme
MDIYLISDAIKVIPLYINVFQMILIVVGIIAVISGLVMLFKRTKVYTQELPLYKQLLHSGFKFAVIFLLTYAVAASLIINGYVQTHFGNLAQAYKQYGFVYCFTSSIKDRGISKSKEYSEEYIDGIKDELDESVPDASESSPNIIFVQLESFFDPKLVKGVTFSSNPTPNLDRIMKEYSSGYLSVPCFGAGTANTEFEVQTGVNLDDFGPGEYPYRTVMQSKTCESAAYDLRKLGYSTHAIHNNDATFYDRYKVFSHLGYDTFTSIEYMDSDYQKTPLGWAKDKMLTAQIKKALDSTEGADYIFTISVQGHGDYPTTMPEGFISGITVSGFFDEEEQVQFEYYVNQIHEMDTFIGELTNMLSRRNEETVLVMYGDHLPTFNFTNDTMENGDIYQTEYFIWSNYGLEKEDIDLQAYQLSAAVFDRLGISEGYIMKFHQAKHNDADYLKKLKVLEYDILYGDKQIYGGKVPYVATDLKMGIDDITIDVKVSYPRCENTLYLS